MNKNLLLMEVPSFTAGIFLGLTLIPGYNYSPFIILILLIVTAIIYSLATMLVMYYIQTQKSKSSEERATSLEKNKNLNPKENCNVSFCYVVNKTFMINNQYVYPEKILLFSETDNYMICETDSIGAVKKERVNSLLDLNYLKPL